MHTNRIKWLKGASLHKVGMPHPRGACDSLQKIRGIQINCKGPCGFNNAVGQIPPREVILHKGCVFSDPYLTQGTCRITPTRNLCCT